MIDVITIVGDQTPSAWVTDCVQSIEAAKARSKCIGETIRTPYVEGHIGKAISAGVKKSKSAYICFVDDDDLILPNAFTCLEPHLASQPSAVFAREFHLLANGRIMMINRRHHLTAYRRDVLESIDFTDLRVNTAPAMIEAAERIGTVVDEFSWVYLYRIYKSRAMKIRHRLQSEKVNQP